MKYVNTGYIAITCLHFYIAYFLIMDYVHNYHGYGHPLGAVHRCEPTATACPWQPCTRSAEYSPSACGRRPFPAQRKGVSQI